MGKARTQTAEWYEGGRGSTLVLMHGFGGTWRMWKPLAPLIEKRHRVTAADARDSLDRTLKMTILKEYFDEHLRPMRPLPADCKVPLRVVWGAEDKVLTFDGYGQPLLDLLGLKTHVMLPGCGHNPVYDDTQGVASAILDFTLAVDAGLR